MSGKKKPPRCPECGRRLKKREQVCTEKWMGVTVDELAQAIYEVFNRDDPHVSWNLHQPYNDHVVEAHREAAYWVFRYLYSEGIGTAFPSEVNP